ncbi:MAG: GNAT family N-acetyltransferase [Clostridiales Family XIII bacterium]|jgi:GNAT superfamily N-acetyltransferase|nr:GNAT family N-acetyltransferase [Clostridiales Family XIII bacterium]
MNNDNIIYENVQDGITIRLAVREDANFIFQMVQELAAYEHALEDVHSSPEHFEKWLFDTPVAECLIATLDGANVGIALFFTNFSTWEGVPGFFLEDLVVMPDARGKGLGKSLFQALAILAQQRGYIRLEWSCLDWNEPSLDFYKSLGALARTDWIPHRLDLAEMQTLAQVWNHNMK